MFYLSSPPPPPPAPPPAPPRSPCSSPSSSSSSSPTPPPTPAPPPAPPRSPTPAPPPPSAPPAPPAPAPAPPLLPHPPPPPAPPPPPPPPGIYHLRYQHYLLHPHHLMLLPIVQFIFLQNALQFCKLNCFSIRPCRSKRCPCEPSSHIVLAMSSQACVVITVSR